jgi:multiple sugar transport system permease protein
MPVLTIVMLFSIIQTFSDFQIVQVLTRGGPTDTTHLFATLAFQIGMQGGRLGQGAAASLFMLPFLGLLVIAQLWCTRRNAGQ